jgi:glycosyltransferase involved in cell wall biosynthesis
MKILALEPYYGGSHRAFLDSWIQRSKHEWDLLSLPANKWKWRMRAAAIEFADVVKQRLNKGRTWDVIFCSDMLNLAEFLGLAGPDLRQVPSIVYFHENQLTYPSRFEQERDNHFAMTNMTTGLAAKNVWFNSAFHRDDFLSALKAFLKRMPDHRPLDALESLREKSRVYPQGITSFAVRGKRTAGPVRIIWAARWEHDKNPEAFFNALERVKEKHIDFRMSVIGEQFKDAPEVFTWARDFFSDHIDRWGYQENREAYAAALEDADIVVSTANHEFFGISIVEAIAAGAYPVLPKRLSYPEIVSGIETEAEDEFFYDGSAKDLAEKIISLADMTQEGKLWGTDSLRGVRGVKRFTWENLIPVLDEALGATVEAVHG